MQFLIKNNHTDMLILKQIKESVRTASAHNATVIANGLMHLGTTTDDFLRCVLKSSSRSFKNIERQNSDIAKDIYVIQN